MMKYILKILQFLNLLDSNNNASISNILVIAAAVYLGINPDDIVAISGAGLALLNYGHKRHEATKFLKEKLKDVSKETVKELTDKLNDVDKHVSKVEELIPRKLEKLEKEITATQTQVQKDVQEITDIKKLTDDLADKISKSALSSVFKQR